MIFFFILLFLNFILFLNYRPISNFLNIYDKPSGIIKKHKIKVSLLGGYIFYFNFVFIFLSDFFFNLGNLNEIFEQSFESKVIFFINVQFIFFIAFVDDRINMKAITRLILLVFTCSMLVYSNSFSQLDYFKSHYFDTFYFNNSKFLLSVLILISIINILNFFDGANLQSGIFFNYVLVYFLLFDFNIIIIYFLIINNIFLFFNFKNKMFLGDFGVYVIAIFLSMFLMFYYRNFHDFKFENVFLLLFFPIIDFLRLIISRILKNKNPMHGDRNHIHHIAINKYKLYKYNLIMSIIYLLNLVGLYFNLFLLILLFNLIIYFYLIQIKFRLTKFL